MIRDCDANRLSNLAACRSTQAKSLLAGRRKLWFARVQTKWQRRNLSQLSSTHKIQVTRHAMCFQNWTISHFSLYLRIYVMYMASNFLWSKLNFCFPVSSSCLGPDLAEDSSLYPEGPISARERFVGTVNTKHGHLSLCFKLRFCVWPIENRKRFFERFFQLKLTFKDLKIVFSSHI